MTKRTATRAKRFAPTGFFVVLTGLVAGGALAAVRLSADSPSAPVPVRPTGHVPAADRSALRGRVAYSTRAGDIWVMNANGSGRRRVTRSGPGTDFDPSFSPRARFIVFRTSRGRYVPDPHGSGVEGIFVVIVQSKRLREIQPRSGGLFPAWSPDGSLIAFSGLRAGKPGDSIFVMTPGGKRIRDLGNVGAAETATWSPDSRQIAYSGHGGDGNWALWIMNRDGTNKRQLTHPVLVQPAGSGGDYPDAWSPDGKQIVYNSGQFKGRDLYIINTDGTGVRRLTDWPGADGAVAWLRSGQIVFGHFDGDEPLPRWYMVNPDGTNLRSLPWFYGAGAPLDWVQPPARRRSIASRQAPTGSLSDSTLATKKFDSLLQAMAAQGRFNGVVRVAWRGSVLIDRAYGRRGLPADVRTRFRIGSITKTFTAVAMLQLAATGRLDLTDSVCDYVPRCPRPWRAITLTMLLSHTAGLSDVLDRENWRALARVPLTQLVERLRHATPTHRPGARWSYCNACFLVAGYIIERVAREPWFDYVQKQILNPAGMHDTLLDRPRRPNKAVGYFTDRLARLQPAPFQALGTPDPAGGLLSTVHDLSLFSEALSNRTLLPPRWLELMQQAAPATNSTWGLGWELGARRGHRFARHTGSIQGWSAMFNRYVDDDLTLIILSNLSDGNVDFINHQIPAIIFGWPYTFPTAPRAVELPEAALERYVGTYKSTRGSLRLEVNRTPDGLVLYPGPSGGGDRLLPLSETRFADQHDPRWDATFTLQNGRAVQLRIRNLPQRYSFLARRVDDPERRPASRAAASGVPPPTGSLPVGAATLSLLDRARRDPLAKKREPRRILAEVYYPAATRSGRLARYVPAGVARALAREAVATALGSVTTNAYLDARARAGRYPVLIFSPGYSVPHYLYTGLLEDLASRGYVVVAVDHTYETEAVQFPDGTIVRRTLPADPRNLIFKPIRARIDDVSFVLTRLTSLTRLPPLIGADATRVGLLGHSLGGLTAANAAATHRSVSCAADIAGSVYGDGQRQKPFRRPFLILDGAQREATLSRWWANLKGTRYWVKLTEAEHLNFTDWTWLAPRLRAQGLTPHVENLGAIDGTRALRLERHYLVAFFDECLKDRPSSVFGDPAPYPDVIVRR